MPDASKSKSTTEKREIDEKLDDALEESFPGSDPVSISQPASDEKPQKPTPTGPGDDDRKTPRSIPIDKLNASNDE
jgi:hypothetical protein